MVYTKGRYGHVGSGLYLFKLLNNNNIITMSLIASKHGQQFYEHGIASTQTRVPKKNIIQYGQYELFGVNLISVAADR